MRLRQTYLAVSIVVGLLAASAAISLADPATTFIVQADSVLSASGKAALGSWLKHRTDLVGAAVAQLIDVGVTVGDDGQKDGESENIALAEALAQANEELTGSTAATRLIEEYRGWDEAGRARRREAKALESQAEQQRQAGELEAAVQNLEAAEVVYSEIGDTHSRAVIFGTLGVVHWGRGDYEAVARAYERALDLRRQVGDRILEGRTLNGLGSVNFVQGQIETAIGYYHQAVEVRRQTGDLSGLGTSLTYLGNAYLQLGEIVEAREFYEQALPVLQRVGTVSQVVENLIGTGNLLDRMGRYADAASKYQQALKLCEAADDCGYMPLLYINLSISQRYRGAYREALQSLARAEQLLVESPDAGQSIRMHLEWASLAVLLGERDDAREHMVSGLRLARESGNAGTQCDAQIDVATLYQQLDATEQAVEAARQARELADGMEDPTRRRDALAVSGDSALQAGAYLEAVEFFEAAQQLDEESGALGPLADDELGRGASLSKLGRVYEARESLHRSVALMRKSGREDDVWRALLSLGDTFEQENPDSAGVYYDRALDWMERRGAVTGGEAFRTGYLFADRGRAYEEITRFYAQQHGRNRNGGWMERAFVTAERSKARGLVDLIGRSFSESVSPEVGALIDSLYEADASTDAGQRERDRLRRRLAEQRAQYVGRALGTELAAPAPLGFEQLRKELPKKVLLLQYAVGDSASFLWVIDRKTQQMVELPGREELRRWVREIRDAIAQPGAGDRRLRHGGHDLYEILLSPAENRIVQAESIVIVPDDALLELPFEVLVRWDPAGGAPWRVQPFFGKDYTPIYVPSSTVYLQLARRAEEEEDREFDLELVALGDPDYSSLDLWSDRDGEPLAALPASRQEVMGIGTLIPSVQRVVLVGEQANEAAFKSTLRTRSPRVVHLATHGLIDPVEPSRSCVALTRVSPEDGYLYSLEILSLSLPRPMVVLSACESALGRLERGEGVVGLTRAFLAAGASGVIASLWPVSDESTAALMQEFYRLMWDEEEPRTAAEALREARLALMQNPEWEHPYFWAPFVLVGTERMPW